MTNDDVLRLPFAGGFPPDEEYHRSLMVQIQGGNRESLQALIDRFSSQLLTYAIHIVGNSDDAEDVVQDTFVQIWLHRAEWHPARGTVSAYLYRITRNLSLNALRHRHAQEKWDKLSGEELFHCATPVTADEDFEEELLREEIESAIASLPERRREIFILSRFHGLTHREIADTLVISPQTVSNQMCSALADLRDALRHRFER